jgi:hypothetical protein
VIILIKFKKINIIENPDIEIKNNKIIIYNYIKLIDLKNNTVETKKYIIIGNNLTIFKMNKYDLVIKGNLSNIKVKTNEEILN